MKQRDWGFGPEFWGFRSGKSPRRRRVWFEPGDMKHVILKLLKDKPRHGYEVMKALEERETHAELPSRD